jgi:hypothetical protein
LSTGPPLVSPSVLSSSVSEPRLPNRPNSITIPPMRATSHSCSVAASPDGRLVASGSSGAQLSHALVSAVFGACRECRLLCRALALREDGLRLVRYTHVQPLLRIAHAHLCTLCATRAPTMQRHDFGTAERYVARPTLVQQRSHGWCNTQHPNAIVGDTQRLPYALWSAWTAERYVAPTHSCSSEVNWISTHKADVPTARSESVPL